ncbi:RNA polymerase sigma factor (sigma-70 family) [Clostridium algifaecis]|uniref:RNA polymerase sigma factor (Sigma-70 family) n=1 Tax=Clostridium algifaecis TaxID=1472040 RepID=A0ABS4KS34_9CLOT|nr:sigma-70 family RNA polymerase sigma factor [Clostridium algifaecis]MBP2032226.1 RNA polymerase sigma factor (sigma-70 family) [Clostridium algifaecis]
MVDKIELESLVKKSQEGDKEALELVCRNFKWFIIKNCNKIYIKNYEMNDLIQIANIGLIKAVKMYKITERHVFAAYAAKSIINELNGILRTNLKNPFSFSLYNSNIKGEEFIDTLVSDVDIEEEYIQRESYRDVIESMDKLSQKEKDIIVSYYFMGITLKDYVKKNKMTYRNAVYRKRNALDKLRKKLKK